MAWKNAAYLKNLVQSTRWFYAFMISIGACFLIYLTNIIVSEVHPRSIWGLSYGTAAAVLFFGVAFYGIRRRRMNWVWGRTQTWVQFHVYAGTLYLLLIFMHSGFRIPIGMVTWWLWVLSIWITFSGMIGVIFQKWIPKILASGLSIEVHYDRIPELTEQIRERAEEIMKDADVLTQEFYRTDMADMLRTPQVRLIYFIDITGGDYSYTKQFNYLREILPDQEDRKIDQLEALYNTKLGIDAHYTLQKALRWWLYAHVPIAFVLLVLLGLHLYSVFYF